MFGNHKHKGFNFGDSYQNYKEFLRACKEYDVDGAVERLITENRSNKKAITELQADLSAIHAHYRSELCNDCCHSEVCKLRPNVKYGFECEDKGYELEVELYEIEPEKEATDENHI